MLHFKCIDTITVSFYANFLCIDTSTFSKLSFLQPTGRRRIFLSEEQICNLLWHSQPIVNCVNWKLYSTYLKPTPELTCKFFLEKENVPPSSVVSRKFIFILVIYWQTLRISFFRQWKNAGSRKQSANSHARGLAKHAAVNPKIGTKIRPINARAIISNTPANTAKPEKPIPWIRKRTILTSDRSI